MQQTPFLQKDYYSHRSCKTFVNIKTEQMLNNPELAKMQMTSKNTICKCGFLLLPLGS